jgi:hypothetical protein
LSTVVLLASVVVAGNVARPLICTQPWRELPTRNSMGLDRGEGKEVEILSGVIALDCRATWAVQDSPEKGFVRLVLLVAVGTFLWKKRTLLRIQVLLRWCSVLWVGAAGGMAWEFASELTGWHRPEQHEFILLRSPFSPYRDGLSAPLSLSDVYLMIALALLAGYFAFGLALRYRTRT